MANSIKQFIIRRLKENVPLSEIRDDLKEKGYDLESINRAVKDAISGIGKKTSNTALLQIGILVIGVALTIGIAIYLNVAKQPSIYFACNDFPSKIQSCEKSIATAIENYPGELLKISRERMEFPDENNELVMHDVWFIVINLKEPSLFNDKNVNKLSVQVDVADQKILTLKEAP